MTTHTGKLHWGTVIHGTLRSEDLLEAFANELETHDASNKLIAEARELHAKLESYQSNMADWSANAETEESACEVIGELSDALSAIAAEFGGYFGNTEGDGSDFGFWPNEESEA